VPLALPLGALWVAGADDADAAVSAMNSVCG
jgi:hypothetical protein